MWSSYRAQQKAGDRKKAGGEEPTARKPRGTSTPRSSAGGDADIIGALEALKPLVKELGAERLKRLVVILG